MKSKKELTNDVGQQIIIDLFEGKSTILEKFSFGVENSSEGDTCKEGYEKQIIALNTIARAFSTEPYTAVVECADNEHAPLIVALSNKSKIPSYEVVNAIKNSLLEVCKNQNNESAKIMLFQNMYLCRNSSLFQLLKKEEDVLRQTKKTSLDNDSELLQRKIQYFKELKENITKRTVELNYKNIDLFNNFVENNFSTMFSPEDLLALNGEERLKRKLAANITNKNNRNKNIDAGQKGILLVQASHVETAGGQVKAMEYQKSGTFNWGLANSTYYSRSNKFKDPLCCASCTAERKVFINELKLEINVSGVSEDNFPPRGFKPSTIITSSPVLFHAYLCNLKEQSSQKINKGQGDEMEINKAKAALEELQQNIRKLEELIPFKNVSPPSEEYLKDGNIKLPGEARIPVEQIIFMSPPEDIPTIKTTTTILEKAENTSKIEDNVSKQLPDFIFTSDLENPVPTNRNQKNNNSYRKSTDVFNEILQNIESRVLTSFRKNINLAADQSSKKPTPPHSPISQNILSKNSSKDPSGKSV